MKLGRRMGWSEEGLVVCGIGIGWVGDRPLSDLWCERSGGQQTMGNRWLSSSYLVWCDGNGMERRYELD